MGKTPHVTTRIGALLTRAIRANAERMAADLPSAVRGDSDGIHDVRVASRRLRAALPIAGEAARVDVRALSRDVRRVTRALSAVREADVVRDLIQALPGGDGRMPAAIAHVDARCARWRAREGKAARAALEKLDAPHLASRLDALADALAEAAEAQMAAAFVAETRRRLRVLAEALDEAGMVYAVEPLHRLRIAAKKLRYVLETGSRALPGIGARATRRLRRLQGRLGHLHDMQMAQQYVRMAAAEALATPSLGAELANLDRALEIQCRKGHADALKTTAGFDQLLADLHRASANLLAPRKVGRMAGMRLVGRRRLAGR